MTNVFDVIFIIENFQQMRTIFACFIIQPIEELGAIISSVIGNVIKHSDQCAYARSCSMFLLRNWSWTYSFRCYFDVYPRVERFQLNRKHFVFQRIQTVRVKAIGACHQFFIAGTERQCLINTGQVEMALMVVNYRLFTVLDSLFLSCETAWCNERCWPDTVRCGNQHALICKWRSSWRKEKEIKWDVCTIYAGDLCQNTF